jgi:hypothetical protein
MDHREAASRFRLLADIEPLPNVRQHFRQLAAEHDEAAADFGERNCGDPRPIPKRRWLVLSGGPIVPVS